MRRTLRRTASLLLTAATAVCCLTALEAAPRKAPDALRYQTTYESAMLEARLRGVPIFFSRHKDG